MSKLQAEKYMSAFEVISKINTLSKDGLRVQFGTSDPVKIQLIADINLNIIKELIDKEVPMKPVEGTLCGNCKSPLFINNFRYRRCLNSKCEQKVDWSDEE